MNVRYYKCPERLFRFFKFTAELGYHFLFSWRPMIQNWMTVNVSSWFTGPLRTTTFLRQRWQENVISVKIYLEGEFVYFVHLVMVQSYSELNKLFLTIEYTYFQLKKTKWLKKPVKETLYLQLF